MSGSEHESVAIPIGDYVYITEDSYPAQNVSVRVYEDKTKSVYENIPTTISCYVDDVFVEDGSLDEDYIRYIPNFNLKEEDLIKKYDIELVYTKNSDPTKTIVFIYNAVKQPETAPAQFIQINDETSKSVIILLREEISSSLGYRYKAPNKCKFNYEPYTLDRESSHVRINHTSAFDVTDASNCFDGCISLTTAPTIPSSVTNISACFYNCTSLTTAPTIPSSVTDMSYCFDGCASLTTSPTIPNGVTNMDRCFYNCTSLTTAPTIPSSVTNISACFNGCLSLTGNCVINSKPNTDYGEIFLNTEKGLWLTGSSTKLNEIAANYDNVFVGSIPTPKIVSTIERVENKFDTVEDIDGEWFHVIITGWNWADFRENDITNLYVIEDGVGPLAVSTWYSQNGDVWDEINFSGYSPTNTSEAHAWFYVDEFTHTYAISADDKYGQGSPIYVTVPQSKRLLDFKAGGTGMAIGMPSTEDGLHIDFDTTFYNSVQKPDMTTAEITAFINELRGVTS